MTHPGKKECLTLIDEGLQQEEKETNLPQADEWTEEMCKVCKQDFKKLCPVQPTLNLQAT